VFRKLDALTPFLVPLLLGTQVYLTNEKKLTPSSILIAVAALRFLYKVTLHRDWAVEEIIPAPKKPEKLPIILSSEEVLQFNAYLSQKLRFRESPPRDKWSE
jgi:site-specific recombinase XerD